MRIVVGQNNQYAKHVSRIVFFILFVLVTGSTYNWNFPAYRQMFSLYSTTWYKGEWLFGLCLGLFKNSGLSIHLMFFVLFGICLMLIRYVAKAVLGSDTWRFYIVFFIIPVMSGISAMRNFITIGFITYAVYLLTKGEAKYYIYAAIMLFIGTGFHTSTFVYFIAFLYILYWKRPYVWKNIFKLLIAVIVLLTGVMLASSSVYNGITSYIAGQLIEQNITNVTKLVYFSVSGRFGFLLFAGIQAVCIYVQYKINKQYKVEMANSDIEYTGFRLTSIVLFLDIAFCIFIPLYRANSNFFRMFMNLIPLNCISVFRAEMDLPTSSNGFSIYRLSTFFFLILIIYGITDASSYFEYNVIPMFNQNWILGTAPL